MVKIQVALVVKNPPANAGEIKDNGLIPRSGTNPWRRAWQPTPVFLAGQFCGHRNLASYSPWGHKESDTIEWLTLMNVFRYVFLYILHIKICYVLLLWELRLQIKLSLLIS